MEKKGTAAGKKSLFPPRPPPSVSCGKSHLTKISPFSLGAVVHHTGCPLSATVRADFPSAEKGVVPVRLGSFRRAAAMQSSWRKDRVGGIEEGRLHRIEIRGGGRGLLLPLVSFQKRMSCLVSCDSTRPAAAACYSPRFLFTNGLFLSLTPEITVVATRRRFSLPGSALSHSQFYMCVSFWLFFGRRRKEFVALERCVARIVFGYFWDQMGGMRKAERKYYLSKWRKIGTN